MAALYRCNKAGSGGYSNYVDKDPNGYGSASNHTFTSMEVGKPYLLLMWAAGSSALNYQRFDGATATGATLTKITNMNNANANGTGTFYKLVPTSASVTVSHTNASRVKLFKAE